jgi:hypothetical protein
MTITTKYSIVVVTATFTAALIFSSSNAFALPPDPGYSNGEGVYCNDMDVVQNEGALTCCWFEEPNSNPGGTLERYCQTCTTDGQKLICDQKELQFNTAPPKSGDSVFQGDDKAVDDQRNPKSPLSDQRIIPGNGVLEQPEDSSNNQDNTDNIPLNGGVLRE